MSSKPIFIVWSSFSPRAETLAEELGAQVSFQYETRLAEKGRWLNPLRWLVQGWKTWQMLEREQPELVLVQAPPIFAPLVVAAWCQLRGQTRSLGCRTRYVLDAHTGAFHHHHWLWTFPLLRILARKAVATLVTDEAAIRMLQSWKARSFLLVSGLPRLSPPVGLIGSQGDTRVAVINTFSDVEPVEEVFAAARLLPQVTFYVTGDTKRSSPRLLEQKPENVVLTGFLRGGNYSTLLNNVQGIVVLSKEPNDLSHGAYEALVMTKPAVVSSGPEMQRFFTRGVVHVENTPEAIAAGINQMLEEQAVLVNEVKDMRSELTAKRLSTMEEFAALL